MVTKLRPRSRIQKASMKNFICLALIDLPRHVVGWKPFFITSVSLYQSETKVIELETPSRVRVLYSRVTLISIIHIRERRRNLCLDNYPVLDSLTFGIVSREQRSHREIIYSLIGNDRLISLYF